MKASVASGAKGAVAFVAWYWPFPMDAGFDQENVPSWVGNPPATYFVAVKRFCCIDAMLPRYGCPSFVTVKVSVEVKVVAPALGVLTTLSTVAWSREVAG